MLFESDLRLDLTLRLLIAEHSCCCMTLSVQFPIHADRPDANCDSRSNLSCMYIHCNIVFYPYHFSYSHLSCNMFNTLPLKIKYSIYFSDIYMQRDSVLNYYQIKWRFFDYTYLKCSMKNLRPNKSVSTVWNWCQSWKKNENLNSSEIFYLTKKWQFSSSKNVFHVMYYNVMFRECKNMNTPSNGLVNPFGVLH